MIIAVIYFVHVIFAAYAFCKSYQNDGWLQAFLNLGFIITLFAVSLTVCELIVGIFIPDSGYRMQMPGNPVLLFLLKISGFYSQSGNVITLTPKDTITLVLVGLLELFFYRFYFKKASITKIA
jgi:membrane protease YdiL (CAAX protease family)